jgi:hypothetical protein
MKKCPFFENIKTISRANQNWDHAQITCQNAKIKSLIHP